MEISIVLILAFAFIMGGIIVFLLNSKSSIGKRIFSTSIYFALLGSYFLRSLLGEILMFSILFSIMLYNLIKYLQMTPSQKKELWSKTAPPQKLEKQEIVIHLLFLSVIIIVAISLIVYLVK